jgi:D-arabinose 1-dehydrogenase-like Zn-dependent alcohol dehydrogenase
VGFGTHPCTERRRGWRAFPETGALASCQLVQVALIRSDETAVVPDAPVAAYPVHAPGRPMTDDSEHEEARMKAVTWHGRRDVRVDTVDDPRIEQPTDAIVRITTTNICGSDLHLYEVLGPFMAEGDVLGHEPMGIVEEVGSDVTNLQPGDRVVIPFQVCCGHCFMCEQGLQTQCETTQVREHGMGAMLFGYTKLYGEDGHSKPGGQAELLRVPQAQYTHIKVPEGPPDDRFVYLSDVLPTAWQAVQYADIPRRCSTSTSMGATSPTSSAA